MVMQISVALYFRTCRCKCSLSSVWTSVHSRLKESAAAAASSAMSHPGRNCGSAFYVRPSCCLRRGHSPSSHRDTTLCYGLFTERAVAVMWTESAGVEMFFGTVLRACTRFPVQVPRPTLGGARLSVHLSHCSERPEPLRVYCCFIQRLPIIT